MRTGQVLGLLVQFGIILSIGNDSNPRDTQGERGAVGVATIWLAVFSSLGISLLKVREGPPFPEGQIHLSHCELAWILGQYITTRDST